MRRHQPTPHAPPGRPVHPSSGPGRRGDSGPRGGPSVLLRLGALAVLGPLGLGAGCSGGPPPAPGGVDASLVRDGAVLDGGVVSQRPDGPPRLPSADRIVALPYMAPAEEVVFRLTATPAQLDVHFSVDTTGSFGAEIDAMQEDLEERLIPEIRARVANSAFGVSRFEDFPVHPFGDPADLPFRLLSPVTTDVSQVRAGVDGLDRPLGAGGDVPEAGFEALYQIATGAGLQSGGSTLIAPYAGGGLGGVGFREGALHAIVHITDAPAHAANDYGAAVPDAHSEDEARAALAALPVFVLAAVGSEDARSSLHALVVGSGAVVPPVGGQCRTGLHGAARAPEGGLCPLLFDIASDGTGLSDAILDAITGLVETLSFGAVRAEFDADRLGFIQSFEATSATVLMGVTPPTRVDSAPTDGVFDAFEDVHGGTELVFTLRLRNVLLRDLDYEQVFRIYVRVMGDGVVLLEETLRIVVPAALPAGPADAGPADDAGTTDGGEIGDNGP